MKKFTTKETFALAVKNHQKNNLKVACNLYQEILKTNPNHVDANNNLGLVFHAFREPQKAKSCYQKAIEIHPDYPDAHSNLGNVLRELGEHKNAKNCYQKAIEIQPNYADSHYNLGIIGNNFLPLTLTLLKV